MLREDNLVIGFAIGAVLPVLVNLGITSLFELMESMGVVNKFGQPFTFQERTTALISICANLIPFQLYSRLRNTNSMRGILLSTGIFAIGWLWIYGRALFAD